MPIRLKARRRDKNRQRHPIIQLRRGASTALASGNRPRLHGHTYRLEVTITGPVGTNGIVIDFADLKSAVERALIDRLDHTAQRQHRQPHRRAGRAAHPRHAHPSWAACHPDPPLGTPDCCVEVRP
ncbi:6-carboxytetrahydropterin synthase [Dactylosporangium roseum]|uniref:6-carboxy-5,6,7,8-tetrahydropterin synthase n=1 Tax=Dactylosporangium roseum TaxID=47989 RepID=A0ABY5Z5S2_9ACTN|nr:6-carboxytetrahydropterin synthase [Dactylosporangium roseum]